MKQIATQTGFCIKTDYNLIEIHFFNDVTVDVDDMNETFTIIERLSDGGAFSLLWVLNEFTYMTMEALLERINYNLTIKNRIIAEAIIVKSLQTRLLERYYLNRNKNHYPIMIFTNKQAGKLWLKKNKVINLQINPQLSNESSILLWFSSIHRKNKAIVKICR